MAEPGKLSKNEKKFCYCYMIAEIIVTSALLGLSLYCIVFNVSKTTTCYIFISSIVQSYGIYKFVKAIGKRNALHFVSFFVCKTQMIACEIIVCILQLSVHEGNIKLTKAGENDVLDTAYYTPFFVIIGIHLVLCGLFLPGLRNMYHKAIYTPVEIRSRRRRHRTFHLPDFTPRPLSVHQLDVQPALFVDVCPPPAYETVQERSVPSPACSCGQTGTNSVQEIIQPPPYAETDPQNSYNLASTSIEGWI